MMPGVYYPTTHLFFIEGVNIIGALSDFASDKKLLLCCCVMKAKWCDYFTNSPIIYLLSSVFDPRKLDGLKDYLEMYYTCLDLKVDIAPLCINVRTLFVELYDDYARIYGINFEQSDPLSKLPLSSLPKGYQLLALKREKRKFIFIIHKLKTKA